jgi:hypothetical protein
MPMLGFIAGTRVALGCGIGLLVSRNLPDSKRRSVGAALVAVGALTTIAAARTIFQRMNGSRKHRRRSMVDRDERLIGATRFPRKGDDDYM